MINTKQLIHVSRLTEERATREHPELAALYADRNTALNNQWNCDPCVDYDAWIAYHAAARLACERLTDELKKYYSIII